MNKEIENFTHRLGFCEKHGFTVNHYPTGIVSFMPFSSCHCGFTVKDVNSLEEAIKLAGRRKHHRWFKELKFKNISFFILKYE